MTLLPNQGVVWFLPPSRDLCVDVEVERDGKLGRNAFIFLSDKTYFVDSTFLSMLMREIALTTEHRVVGPFTARKAECGETDSAVTRTVKKGAIQYRGE